MRRRKAAASSRCLAASGALVCSLLLLASVAPADATDHIDSKRPEAWAMFYFTSVSLFSGLGTPKSRELGEIEAGLELGTIPDLDSAERTVGFDGTKEEDLNKAPIFARGRSDDRAAVEDGADPRLRAAGKGLRAARPPLRLRSRATDLRARSLDCRASRSTARSGTVEGDFTCPEDAADEPPGSPGNPYGCEGRIEGQGDAGLLGLEVSGSYARRQLRGLTPWVTLSGNYLDTRFQVKADTFGFRDRTHLKADTGTVTFGLGLLYPLTDRIDVSVGMSFTPLWVERPPSTSDQQDSLFNARSVVSYRFR